MKANFNNKVMMNNGLKVIGSGVRLINGACNAFQIATSIIIVADMGCRIVKYIDNKRKQAKLQTEVVDGVKTEDIETTEE